MNASIPARRSFCIPGIRRIAACAHGAYWRLRRGRIHGGVRWYDVDARGLLGDLGHELHRARARPHDRDALAREVDGVIPARGVEARPGEVAHARELGQPRAAELPAGEHERIGLDALAAGGAQRPRQRVVVELRARDLGVQPHAGDHAAALGDVAQVVVDLGLRRARARPVAALVGGEGVQVGRHVARGARVGVVVPHAADVAAALEHRDVGVAGPAQRDGHADPADPRPDDRDPHPGDPATRLDASQAPPRSQLRSTGPTSASSARSASKRKRSRTRPGRRTVTKVMPSAARVTQPLDAVQ